MQYLPMTPELFIQYLFAGITYGIIYAIVAIGFNIISSAGCRARQCCG